VILPPDKERQLLERAKISAGQTVNQVGALYEQIVALCQQIDESEFKEDVAQWQSDPTDGWPVPEVTIQKDAQGNVVRVGEGVLVLAPRTRQEAITALQAIALQGEAASPEMAMLPTSHFARFLSIWND